MGFITHCYRKREITEKYRTYLHKRLLRYFIIRILSCVAFILMLKLSVYFDLYLTMFIYRDDINICMTLLMLRRNKEERCVLI